MVARPIAEWLTTRVHFKAGGTRWPIVFTHRILLACEELTGVDMLAENMSHPSAALLRALLYLALDRAGAGLGIDAAGRCITRRTIGLVRATLAEAWAASMPDPEKAPESRKGSAKLKKVTWLDAWAAGRWELGLSAEEWLDMTPRMARALSACRMETVRQREFMASRAIAMGANFSFCAPKKPFQHDQFMLNPWPGGQAEEAITGEYIMDCMAASRGRRG